MGTEYLLDTNTIIDFAAQKLPNNSHNQLAVIIDTSPQMSIINKIELLSFHHVPAQIIAFIETALIIPLSENIIEETIHLRKNYKLKLPDAIIAATALVFDLVLISHNISDFKNIKDLQLIDSYEL